MARTKITSYQKSTPVAFHAYRSAAQAFTATTATKIPFDAEEFDEGSNFDSTTNRRFTAPVAGLYHFDAAIGAAAITPTRMFIMLYKNGSEYKRGNDTGNTVQSVTVGTTVKLAANDYIEVFYWSSTSGGNMAGQNTTHFSGFLISTTS